MSVARDEKSYFQKPPPGDGFLVAGALLIASALGVEAASLGWQGAFALAAIGAHVAIRGWRLKKNLEPRVTLSELGITDLRGFGGPIAWDRVASMSRKTLPAGEALVFDLRDGKTLTLSASLFAKHDFDHIQSFALLYHQRYGATK